MLGRAWDSFDERIYRYRRVAFTTIENTSDSSRVTSSEQFAASRFCARLPGKIARPRKTPFAHSRTQALTFEYATQ